MQDVSAPVQYKFFITNIPQLMDVFRLLHIFIYTPISNIENQLNRCVYINFFLIV